MLDIKIIKGDNFIIILGTYKAVRVIGSKIDYVKLENLETRIYMKNKYLFFILFLTFSLSWTPKAVYHEDLGSFPYYRTVEKIPNFINNYKDLKFLKSN